MTRGHFVSILKVKELMKMAESIMLEKAKDFAVNIVNLCKHIKETKREAVLTNQLLRAGTSIGANIHESKYAHGTADFIAKMQIALKECYESEHWLELLNRTGYIPNEQYKPLHNDCGSIRRMLIASINTAKTNKQS
jgi:four helix bundle protein